MTTSIEASDQNTETAEDGARLHGLMTAFLQSKAVFTALDLGVFEALDGSSKTPEALAEELGLEVRPARAVLVALRGLELVTRDDHGYRNGPEASRFLVSGKPEYMGEFAEHQNQHFANFAKLTDAARTNTSITHRVLDKGYSNQGAGAGEGPEGTRRLISAMRVSSRMQAESLAFAAPLAGIRNMIDLGCGSGDYSVALAEHHPDVHITAMDYPAVCALAIRNVEDAGLKGRVEVRPADIMCDPLPEADAILLSHVLDGYGREQSIKLVRRIHENLPSGGLLLVHSHMPSLAKSVFPYLFGLILLGNTAAGEVHEVSDIESWVTEVGFGDVRTSNVSPLSGLLIAHKA